MKISVIVPVYNCEPYVERCIRSIMAQTYTNLEIICVDDGSTDNSGDILDNLAIEDSRIRVIHQENGGASAARNAGIDVASGELFTFVDSDDAIEPDMYETLIPYFDDKRIDIVHCGYKRIHLDGSVKDVNGTGRVVRQNKYEAAECLVAGRLFVGSLCNKIYRFSLFSDVRLKTDLAINEDVLANAEVFSKSDKIIYIDAGKYLMYERKGSATNGTVPLKKSIDCMVAAEQMLDLFRGTSVESAAEERVLNTQIGLYRWYVMNELTNSRPERQELSRKIDSVLRRRSGISSRQCLNYSLMRYAPSIYRLAYKIYDRIRVPDWDVK